MERIKIKAEIHFVAIFLAKYQDAYNILGYKTQSKTHKKIAEKLKIGEISLRNLEMNMMLFMIIERDIQML